MTDIRESRMKRFNQLLKAMAEGEPPKGRKGQQEATHKPVEKSEPK